LRQQIKKQTQKDWRLRPSFFLFLFLLSAPGLFGQFQYINRLHAGLGVQPGVAGAYHKGKIYTASVTNNVRYYSITRFDSLGQFEKELSFFADSVRSFETCAKCLNVNGSSIYQVTTPFLNNKAPYLLLYKIALNLDTLLKVDTLFVPPIDFGIDSTEVIIAWGSRFDSDSSLLITGFVAAQPTPTAQFRYDLFLAKLDTNFNLLWMTVVTDDNVLRPFGLKGENIMVDQYGGIVVTGNPYFWGFQTGFAARFRASDGQLLWKREYTPDLGFGISNMFVVDNQDGTYQYAMNEWTESTGSGCLVKYGEMDTMGNLVNSSYIGNRFNPNSPGLRSNFAQDFLRTHDGNYYIAGVAFAGGQFGFGAKFTRTGDSLWYREYTHGGWSSNGPVFPPLEQGWIEWFIQKPDSSFLHIGWNQNSYTPVLSTWILNTDKHGCDTLGCETIGLEEFTPTVAWKIYPNPATDYLILQSEQVNAPITQVRLLDLLGKEVWRAECTQAQYGCKLNLPPLAQGMYQLQLLQENRIVGQEKLILGL
jgi:hypothetical protein